MPLTTLFRPLALCVAINTLLISPVVAEQDAAIDPQAEVRLPLEDLRTFAKVFEHIRKAYVNEVDDRTLLEYAIKGMLSELDPHSTYLNASSFSDLQEHTTGEFGGLGIEVGMEDGFVKVISPIDDTPADKAGIEAGDVIIKLDGASIKGLGISDAVKLMRGPKGSDITVTVVREGGDRPFDVVITRDIIKTQSVRSRVLEDGYGYLRIAQFQLNTGDETVKELRQLTEDTDLKGLIVDLRNNPGGVLQSSVAVSDAFLEKGLVVYTEGRVENASMSFEASPGDAIQGLPIVVLINGGSASAAEIVAGALQDHRRAIIMGTRSFGKGSVQTVIPMSEEQAIKLTTALYYTPNGRSIQAQGIEPDIIVERAKITKLQQYNRTTEADLNGHLGNGNGGEENNRNDRILTDQDRESILNRDNQLFEALSLLKGLHLFTSREDTSTVTRTEVAELNGASQ